MAPAARTSPQCRHPYVSRSPVEITITASSSPRLQRVVLAGQPSAPTSSTRLNNWPPRFGFNGAPVCEQPVIKGGRGHLLPTDNLTRSIQGQRPRSPAQTLAAIRVPNSSWKVQLPPSPPSPPSASVRPAQRILPGAMSFGEKRSPQLGLKPRSPQPRQQRPQAQHECGRVAPPHIPLRKVPFAGFGAGMLSPNNGGGHLSGPHRQSRRRLASGLYLLGSYTCRRPLMWFKTSSTTFHRYKSGTRAHSASTFPRCPAASTMRCPSDAESAPRRHRQGRGLLLGGWQINGPHLFQGSSKPHLGSIGIQVGSFSRFLPPH